MYMEKRILSDGTVRYSFWYRCAETGKKMRLKNADIPSFSSEKQARQWAESQTAARSAKQDYIQRKLAWKKQYHNFNALLELYGKWQKDRAPNSWESNLQYLEQWVFPFFLNEKRSANVNDWHLYFMEFTDWLRSPEVSLQKGRRTPLANSSVNNILKTLNTFMECLRVYNHIDPSYSLKAKALPNHLINRRTYKDVIPRLEMENVAARMILNGDVAAAEFFRLLWHFGMRFSELFGLPVTAIRLGEIPNDTQKRALKAHDINYVGYVYLDSQPKHDDRRRTPEGVLERKPLKGNKEISPRFARSIPVETKELWNLLAKRYKAGVENHKSGVYSVNLSDYTFFDDLAWGKAHEALRKAYEDLGLAPKSYHCCRHSFTTKLTGETQNYFLVRAITGHRKDQSFERYLHIFEQISQENMAKDTIIELLD